MVEQAGAQTPSSGSPRSSSTQTLPLGQLSLGPVPERRQPGKVQVPLGQPVSGSSMQLPPSHSRGPSHACPRLEAANGGRQRPVPSLQTNPSLAQEASLAHAGMHAVGLDASLGSDGAQS
jgi:hypothetical protein